MSFKFQENTDDEPLKLENVVFQALGAASACWSNLNGAGIFESTRAKEIGDVLVKWIHEHQPHGPYLGMATTHELLDEVKTRIEMDYYVGGGGLDYKTTTGRPRSVVKEPVADVVEQIIERYEYCVICHKAVSMSEQVWKCCPTHTTSNGPDIVCSICAYKMHPDLRARIRNNAYNEGET